MALTNSENICPINFDHNGFLFFRAAMEQHRITCEEEDRYVGKCCNKRIDRPSFLTIPISSRMVYMNLLGFNWNKNASIFPMVPDSDPLLS